YACRGGPMTDPEQSSHDFYLDTSFAYVPSLGTGARRLGWRLANFMDTPHGLNTTNKAGSYKPNALGLYDMHGNGDEWCDHPEGNENQAVCRGGHWGSKAGDCSATSRIAVRSNAKGNTIGMRVARGYVGSRGK